MRRGFLAWKKEAPPRVATLPASSRGRPETEAEGRQASVPVVGTDVWLCGVQDRTHQVYEGLNGADEGLIGEVVERRIDRKSVV